MVEDRFLIRNAPITPACNISTTAARLADQASARGERLAKNPDTWGTRLSEAFASRAGSASIAANSVCMARADGAPRLSLRAMVSAYSSRIAAYCLASSGSRASASSTRRASRGLSVPAACHGSSNSISLGPSSIFLLNAIMASLVPRWLPSAFRPISYVHRKSLACIEQARLHSVFWYPDDRGHLCHRLLVVVDEIDDLPMFRRKSAQALAQHFTGILLRRSHLRIVGRILDRVGSIQVNVLPAPQRGKRL